MIMLKCAHEFSINRADIEEAIARAVTGNLIYRPEYAFMKQVQKLRLLDWRSLDRDEHFALSLLGNVDFLALADFAEIHAEHHDEGFEKTHHFKEQSTPK
jgi:hypothetical protein